VLEQRLRKGRRGAQVRPFCVQAKIGHRGYSRPLQRALADFGADHSFGEATKKIKEHYGVEVSTSSARTWTLAHAKASGAVAHEAPRQPVPTLITELDGTMLPIVATQTGPELDGRQGKELFWREARLCLARDVEAVAGVYGATFGTAQIAGLLWRQVAETAGLGSATRVHGLGDGANWIIHSFHEQFGGGSDSTATYTVDFHHVSDYLSAAAKVIAPASNTDWLHQQQEALKQNQVSEVLDRLAPYREPEPQKKAAPEEALPKTQPTQRRKEVPPKEAPVRSAYEYIQERRQYLDYAGALAAGLPIGSGEVEGSHRYVLQQRLKIAGAWWLERTAESMLQLRVVRANGDWDKYWTEIGMN
jgi:hypothetical protein